MNNPKLYTVKEAANIVGVSTNTLYKYLDEDRIHAARGSALQGRFRIPQSSLEEFLGISLSDHGNSQPQAKLEESSEVGSSTLQSAEGQTLQDLSKGTVPMVARSLENGNTGIRPSRHLPIQLARILLILALIAILVDLFISRSVSLPAQLSRIAFIVIMLLLAYQEGGYRKG